jgi:hypothetical protein
MSSLENTLQKDFTDKVSAEFRKYCLLLQAYSDTNSWSYECDFILTDAIFWDKLVFYGGGQGVDMEGLVKNYFEYIIKHYITTDLLWDYVDERHHDDVTETGWLYFTLYPEKNKLVIDMAYDFYDNEERDYEEYISDIIDIYQKKDKADIQNQLKKWKEEGAIFKVSYEGSNWNEYIDDECWSNVGISKTPEFIEDLGYIIIQTYEKGYHLEGDGGSGWITVNFKEGIITMEHTEYKKSSYEVELAELNF